MEQMVCSTSSTATVKSPESRKKTVEFSQVQFLIKWWMQQVPMRQKVQQTVEAPRMWYMNTIVDMLEMKRRVPTTQTNRRRKRWKRTRFRTLNEWKEANDDLDAPTRTVCDMVRSCCLEVDVRRSKVNEILATIRHDSTVLETNVEESKAKIVSDTDQAVYALNGGVDFTNEDLAATLRMSDWPQALREYLCSTFFEEDKQRMIAKQLDTD